ncbi:ABC transporter ATP-binding protein [Vaginisenegalia massiliensis]|uniref:ABC transporter ATP-binding protein n=1 Tax=Vaginisenegalia massiliensis TaxID=2058294 RepID=UPI000F529241|nr:ABC transporter ATP-binding protein [Vaginisenegalia massiliensis]
MSYVELKNIGVTYDQDHYILEDLNLAIEQGQLISLLGPSGCGKTTTLRVMAGLIQQQKGQFYVDGQDLSQVPVHKRKFGMVFQSYALFPHLTIYDNVAFGLKLNKLDPAVIKEKVETIMKVCGLEGLGDRFPKQLSGGQRQRVALARALVIEPKLLLLDEPLSNLDAKLRLAMRLEIRRLHEQLGMTTVFVTHDQEECFSISDKVAIMNQGVIEQFASPEEIYRYPKTRFVAEFIGFENFFAVQLVDGQLKDAQGRVYDVTYVDGAQDKKDLVLTIRPEDIQLNPAETSGSNHLSGRVTVRTFMGKGYQYEVETDLGKCLVHDFSQTKYQVGDEVHLYLPQTKLLALNK